MVSTAERHTGRFLHLECENPPILRNRGIFIKFVRPNMPSVSRRTVGRFQLALRFAESHRPKFALGQARYAERMLATGRAGPMVPFDHRPARTHWHPALPGDRSGGFTRLSSSKIPQARIGTGTAGRAVSARLMARRIPQSRVWHPALPGYIFSGAEKPRMEMHFSRMSLARPIRAM